MKLTVFNTITYQNYWKKTLFVSLFCSCSILIQGCAGLGSSQSISTTHKIIENPEPVVIKLKGAKGDRLVTRFYSHSLTKTFLQNQITKQKDEIVEFDIEENVTRRDDEKDQIYVSATAKNKDGMVDLHELAFPEEGETIEYIYTSKAKVLKAGDFPHGSIFYVPPLPLPDGPVSIGDTWEMSEEWRSLHNGMPLQVNLVGILKYVYQCGSDRCADIELSGDVAISSALQADIHFTSEMYGRIIFNVDKGMAVWSMIQGQEDLRVEDTQTLVVSCLASDLKQPQNLQWTKDSKTFCQPKGESIKEIP